MNRKKPDWTTMNLAAFRELTSRIEAPEAASALVCAVDAALRHVERSLAEPPETDAERYPETPRWRERAERAREYLAGKLQIAAARALALGGLDEAALEDAEERASARRRKSSATLGGQLASISRDLAAYDPHFADHADGLECVLCDRAISLGTPLTDHADDCAWRRAVEIVELHPSIEGDLAAGQSPRAGRTRLEAEVASLRRQLEAVEAKLAATKKRYDKQLAHGERMGRERDHYRRLLQVAMRALALSREAMTPGAWESVVAPEVERIRREDAAVASPGFLVDVRLGHEAGKVAVTVNEKEMA